MPNYDKLEKLLNNINQVCQDIGELDTSNERLENLIEDIGEYSSEIEQNLRNLEKINRTYEEVIPEIKESLENEKKKKKMYRRGFIGSVLSGLGLAAGYETLDGYDLVIGEEEQIDDVADAYLDSGYDKLNKLGEKLDSFSPQDDRVLGFDDNLLGGGSIGLEVNGEKISVDEGSVYSDARRIARKEKY